MASGVDLVNEVAPRDWIRSSDITHTTWYEVLSVSETELYLRTAYAGSNRADTATRKKNVDLISDDSLITVDCIGMEYGGEWIRTASDAVKNLLTVDAGIANINTASFDEANNYANYTLSLAIPDQIGGEIPKIRDVITKINESVFGSLVNNTSWELVYNVLNADKPTSLTVLEDHDIIGDVSISSKNSIVKKVNTNYKPFVDRFTGSDSFKFYSYDSDFVNYYIGAKEEKNLTIYLFEDDDALEITQRYALYNSLSQAKVSIKGKLNFMLTNLNDKIYINFERLYKRFGGKNRMKIGIVSKVTKNGTDTSIEFNDIGNTFNRVMSIADDSSNDFTSATDSEKIVNGYVLDDTLTVPDVTSDDFLDCSIIG